jgi:LacI family transcriptional regulator
MNVTRRPTRTDVAKLSGVSVATVSYVVNNGPRPVADETRRRVQDAIDALGYRPHAVARSLKTGSTQTIALLVASLLESFTGFLVNAVEDALAKRDYGLILASTHEDHRRESRMLDVLAAQSVDGLLCIPTSNRNAGQVSALLARGTPVVFLDRTIPGVAADVVMTDNVAAARSLTRHLIEQGCRRILCLSFSEEASSAVDRVDGFRQAHRDAGLVADQNAVLVADYSRGASVEPIIAQHILAQGLPDAILCTTDRLVVSTIKTLKARGVRVPEQVVVAGGFVYSSWNEVLEFPLPFVHQDFQQLAERAVAFLIDRLKGYDGPARVQLVDAELIVSGRPKVGFETGDSEESRAR